jgi:hypothetical protein
VNPVSLLRTGFRANPLIMRTIRQKALMTSGVLAMFFIIPLSISVLGGLGFMLGADNHNGVLIDVLRSSVQVYGICVIIFAATALVNPFFVALTAAELTIADVRAHEHELIVLTLLSNRKLVQSYIFSALYRWRLALVIIAGLMPAFILYESASNAGFGPYITCPLDASYECHGPGVQVIVTSVMTFTTLGLFGLVFNLFAAAVGVAIALLWRQRILAGCAGIIFMLPFCGLSTWLATTDPLAFVSRAVVFSLVMICLTLGMAWLAELLARHRT